MYGMHMIHVIINFLGSFVPPSSQFLQVSFISIGEFIVIGIIVLIGMIFAILLLIFNIVWRNNKYVIAPVD